MTTELEVKENPSIEMVLTDDTDRKVKYIVVNKKVATIQVGDLDPEEIPSADLIGSKEIHRLRDKYNISLDDMRLVLEAAQQIPKTENKPAKGKIAIIPPGAPDILDAKSNISYYKLACELIKRHNLVQYQDMVWSKDKIAMQLCLKGDIDKFSIELLEDVGCPEEWSSQVSHTIYGYVAAKARPITKAPPLHYAFFRNGVVDLRTLQLVEVEEEYAVTAVMPVDFNPEAKCPVVTSVLEKALSPDQREAFLSIFGARLTGTTKLKTHVILTGNGDQGKTVLQEYAARIFGKRMCTDLIANIDARFRSKQFVGCCIVWNGETDGSRKTANYIKKATGGTILSLEEKGKDHYGQVPFQCIFVEDTNSPGFMAGGDANATRLEWFAMKHHFVRRDEYKLHEGDPYYHLMDPQFEETAYTDEELSGFVNLLLPFAQYYLENNELKKHADKSTERLNNVADSVSTFCDQFIECGERLSLYKSRVYDYYGRFCQKIGAQPQLSIVFYERLAKMGAKSGKKHYLKNVGFLSNDWKFYESFGTFAPDDKDGEQEI